MKKTTRKPLNLQTQTSLSPFAFCWFCPPTWGKPPKNDQKWDGVRSYKSLHMTPFSQLDGSSHVMTWPAASCFCCSALWLSKSQMAKSPQPQNKSAEHLGMLSHKKPQKATKSHKSAGKARHCSILDLPRVDELETLHVQTWPWKSLHFFYENHLPDMSGRKK